LLEGTGDVPHDRSCLIPHRIAERFHAQMPAHHVANLLDQVSHALFQLFGIHQALH
jgi:hypothetical protein